MSGCVSDGAAAHCLEKSEATNKVSYNLYKGNKGKLGQLCGCFTAWSREAMPVCLCIAIRHLLRSSASCSAVNFVALTVVVSSNYIAVSPLQPTTRTPGTSNHGAHLPLALLQASL
jgi:hypothetical protein